MNKDKRSEAITQATTMSQPLSITRQSTTRSRKVTIQQEQLIYFNISIYELNEQERPKIVRELQAGKKYTLTVTCETAPSLIDKNLMQQGKSINGAFSLILSYSYSQSTTSIWLPLSDERSFNGIFEEEIEYPMALPIDLPSGNLSISLSLQTSSRKYPPEVAHYIIPASGGQNAFKLELLNVSRINQRLPEKTAILLAEISEQPIGRKQRMHLRGWATSGQQLDDNPLLSHVVSIEELQVYRQRKKQRPLYANEMLDILRHFSYSVSFKMSKWLSELFDHYREQFNLVIVDLTSKEIPWELLEFAPSQYLGAYAHVVRWLPIHYFETQRELAVAPGNYKGSVLSFLDEQDLNADAIRYEREALQQLLAQSYPSLSALRQRLTDSLEHVGLIYVGCHGNNGQGLGRLQQDVPELSSLMLTSIYESKVPGLTIFINACESARVINASSDSPGNFVETFLAHGAAGFIGTLAQVDIQTASTIGKQLLLAALQPGGVQIAELLRLLRKNEIMHLEELKKSNSAQVEDYYRVLDTFMYVYYGNPLAYLQLYPRKEPGQ